MLKDFTNSLDGMHPFGGVIVSEGVLYGTARDGGASGLGTVFKINLSIPLTAEPLGNAIKLSWSDPAFSLQSASQAVGTYTNVSGASRPYTNAVTAPQKFFRLVEN